MEDIRSTFMEKTLQAVRNCRTEKQDRISTIAHHDRQMQHMQKCETHTKDWLDFAHDDSNKPFTPQAFKKIIKLSKVRGIRYDDIPWPAPGTYFENEKLVTQFHPQFYKESKFVDMDYPMILDRATRIFKEAGRERRDHGPG